MLQYINYGPRNFVKEPDFSTMRLNWEFFAVLKGKCAPCINDKIQHPQSSSTLWLFPPWQQYHWVSEDASCTRAVFQIAVLPPIIQQNLPKENFYKIPLSSPQKNLIHKLTKDIYPHYLNPDDTYEFRISRLISELCLLILQRSTFPRRTSLQRSSELRVNKAETFYCFNLNQAPTLTETAKFVGISPSQLRRTFQRVKKMSPHQVFISLRLKCACTLLSSTDWTLDIIAQKSGFKSLVDFHRAFKKEFKVTPTYWRMNCQLKQSDSIATK